MHLTRLPPIACRIYADLFFFHYFYVTATKHFGETANVFLNLLSFYTKWFLMNKWNLISGQFDIFK